jgi:hypothetical protein
VRRFTPAGFYGDRFAEGLSHGTETIGAVGTAGSLADLFSINNCPATSITAANAIANIAVASWWNSFICARLPKLPMIEHLSGVSSSVCHAAGPAPL